MASNELVKCDEKDADLGDDTSKEDSEGEGNDVTIAKVHSAAAGRSTY